MSFFLWTRVAAGVFQHAKQQLDILSFLPTMSGQKTTKTQERLVFLFLHAMELLICSV